MTVQVLLSEFIYNNHNGKTSTPLTPDLTNVSLTYHFDLKLRFERIEVLDVMICDPRRQIIGSIQNRKWR